MANLNILGTISVLISFICIVLAVFLFAAKSDRKLANRLFAAFLVLFAIDVTGWLISGPIVAGIWPNALRIVLAFLQMPFFVGFIAATCFSDFRLRPMHLVHLVPFLFALALTLPGNQLPFAGTEIVSASERFLTKNEFTWTVIVLDIQYYIYMAAAVVILFRFRTVFLQHYADIRSKTFIWLMQLVTVSLIARTLVQAKTFAFFAGWGGVITYLQIAVSSIALGVVTWFTLKALLQPEIFTGVDKTLVKVSRIVRQNKADDGKLAPTTQRAAKLLTYMEEEKPYLDPTLTLQALAIKLDMPAHELSELINSDLGVNFFDFVNRYRVFRAQEMLLADQKRTILEILFEVGFNSKSSFNTAFRKYVGTTPTAYRKAQMTTAHQVD